MPRIPIPARLLFVLAVLATLPAAGAHAQDRFDPDTTWFRLETKHFELLYPKGNEITARYVAAEAESAYRLLTPLFGHAPERRTVIIINTGSDVHNGYATVHPRLTIEIELAPPDTRDTIYSPDYLRQIIFHEFSHILQLDKDDDLRRGLRTIFGDPFPPTLDPLSLLVALLALPPNTGAPTWFIEGGAQWSETEFSAWGRGRMALTQAMLRAKVRANRLPGPGEAVLAAPDWPFGTTAYLWGIAVCAEMQRAYGHRGGSVPGTISHDGGDGFPGLWELETQQLTQGRGGSDVFNDAVKAVAERQNAVLATLRQRPITPMQRLTPAQLQCYGPVVSADGRHIYFVGLPPDDRPALYRIDADGVRRLGLRLSRTSRLWFDPRTPERLLFTRDEPFGVGQFRTRLGSCNLDGGDVKWIVRGRFQESAPIVGDTPDDPERGWLRCEHLTDRGPIIGTLRFLRDGPTGDTWAVGRAPTESPMMMHSPVSLGGNMVAHHAAVVELDATGSRIARYDTNGGRRELFATRAEIMDLARGRQGELWFVCGEGGVLNLWSMNPDAPGSATCMTNVETGLLEVAPTEAGVVAVALDEYGPYLVFIDRADLVARDAPPDVRTPWPSDDDTAEKALDGRAPNDAHLADGLVPLGEPGEHAPVVTSPLPKHLRDDPAATLADLGVVRFHGLEEGFEFHYWVPFVTNGAFNFVAAGGSVAFSDPLDRLALGISAGWDFDLERPIGDIQFRVSALEPVFFLHANYHVNTFSGRVVTFGGQAFDYSEDIATVTLGVRETRPQLGEAWTFGLDLRGEWRDSFDARNSFPAGPYASPPPFEGFRTHAEISAQYDNRTSFPRSVGPESGIYLGAAFFCRPPILDETDVEFGLYGEFGFSLSLPGHQLILARAAGAWGNAPASLQSLFSVGGTSGFFAVRGYGFNAQVGKRAFAGSLAWRFPLLNIYDGPATIPFYWRGVALEFFGDAGVAIDDVSKLRFTDFLLSAGVELQFLFSVNGAFNFDARVGYAYASERPASDRHRIYISLGIPIG
ncbi:MAG: hypothetical protein AB7K09_22100 [Planctomycetota bacterium]